MTDLTILTVGHSTHSIEHFLSLLEKHGVTAVADVRSSPYSRMNPQFNRGSLADALKVSGITYVFLGKELGARSEDPACYEGGQVRYGRLARTALFQAGIEEVLAETATHRVALMCAEKEPLDCHRTVLVTTALAERGVSVEHILADGRIELHESTMLRLLELWNLGEPDMFRSPSEVLEEAWLRQERRIAYVDASRMVERN